MSEPAWETKLARAREHLTALDAEITAHIESGAFKLTDEMQDAGRVLVIRAKGNPTTPTRWSAIIGDVLHNARSSLDYLAFAVVTHGHPDLLERDARRVYFPIHTTHTEWTTHIRAELPGVTESVLQRFLELQPCYLSIFHRYRS
jgi:hypothetical protein